MGSNHYNFYEKTAFNKSIISDRHLGYSQPNAMNPVYSVSISRDTHRSSNSASAVGKSHWHFIYVVLPYTVQFIALNWPNHWKKYKEKEDAEAKHRTLRM